MRREGTACGVTRSWRGSPSPSASACGVAGTLRARPCPAYRRVTGGGIRRAENNSEAPDPGSWEKLKRKLRRLAVGVGL